MDVYEEPMPWMDAELQKLGVLKKPEEVERKEPPPPTDQWWKRGEECPF